ncbi:hypothetical protein SUGI_0334250 [Cryptomeria japonica]|nr:hypothetical protein SUGI_0334250 [Cryptomeria japonica]
MGSPATMKTLGLVSGISLIMLLVILTYASSEILLRFSRAFKATSYGGVMAGAFGPLERVVLQILMIIITLGIPIVYMIVIGDVVSVMSANGSRSDFIVEAFHSCPNVHPMHCEVKTSSQMQAIVKASLALCAAVYITTSFGDQTIDDVLANFDRNLGVGNFIQFSSDYCDKNHKKTGSPVGF